MLNKSDEPVVIVDKGIIQYPNHALCPYRTRTLACFWTDLSLRPARAPHHADLCRLGCVADTFCDGFIVVAAFEARVNG